jgi:hypothetical protein
MKMKFYYTEIEQIKQSAFYQVSKSEVIEYFREGQNDFEAFERIENHEEFRFLLPNDRGTIYRFHPVGDEDYYFQMTISMDNMPPLDERLVQMIKDKEPIEPKSKEASILGPGN